MLLYLLVPDLNPVRGTSKHLVPIFDISKLFIYKFFLASFLRFWPNSIFSSSFLKVVLDFLKDPSTVVGFTPAKHKVIPKEDVPLTKHIVTNAEPAG